MSLRGPENEIQKDSSSRSWTYHSSSKFLHLQGDEKIMSIEKNILSQIKDNMPLWDINYDDTEEKYNLTSSCSEIRLNPEHIEMFRKLGLNIFSVDLTEETLTIKFITSGGFS